MKCVQEFVMKNKPPQKKKQYININIYTTYNHIDFFTKWFYKLLAGF